MQTNFRQLILTYLKKRKTNLFLAVSSSPSLATCKYEGKIATEVSGSVWFPVF